MSNLSYDFELFSEMSEHKERTHLSDGKLSNINVLRLV